MLNNRLPLVSLVKGESPPLILQFLSLLLLLFQLLMNISHCLLHMANGTHTTQRSLQTHTRINEHHVYERVPGGEGGSQTRLRMNIFKDEMQS